MVFTCYIHTDCYQLITRLNARSDRLSYWKETVNTFFPLQIIQLMSSQLDLTIQEIDDAIVANKCDWIASVFHLLIDQPEGRTYMSQIASERSHGQSAASLSPVSSQAPAQMETTVRQESSEQENETSRERSEEQTIEETSNFHLPCIVYIGYTTSASHYPTRYATL